MLLIYLTKTSSRIEYVFELLFRHEWEIEYKTTSDLKIFEAHEAEKINYSDSRVGDEFFINASSLLSENFIGKKEIGIEEKYQTKVLFPNDKSCDLGFDIFAAIFYMVSRYEEYLPFSPDEYGRYKASDSIAFQNNFLEKPVVNTWLSIFKISIQNKFPFLKIKQPAFKAIATYDIDVAYKFKGRNLYRTIGATAKDFIGFNWKNIFQRTQTILNFKKDPWDVYDALSEMIVRNKLDSIFFFLLADKTTNDRNLSHKNPIMEKLINNIKAFSEIGIHPSFTTSEFPEKIAIEKERLEIISHKKITKSRQHFLKFSLPDTYKHLIAAGITEDYSMGFPETPGFRAGICTPFYFYDLKNEKATSLKIFPATFMEGSFMNAGTSMNQTLKKVLDLISQVKNVNGTFISIWHNHTVSETAEYRNWKNIHDEMIGLISKQLRINVS